MTDPDDFTSNPRIAKGARTMSDLIEVRLSRRALLGGLGATGLLAAAGCRTTTTEPATPQAQMPAFDFAEIARGVDHTHHIPEGYESDVLIRWGDALFPDAPAFDPFNQTGKSQLKQFGYNNDFIGWVDHPSGDPDRALLCVNHEYTSTNLMFPGIRSLDDMSKDKCEAEMAAHGGTIVELQRQDGRWRVNTASKYNRRVTGAFTPMRVTGPAAGHPRMHTPEDPDGLTVAGTLNNCAGGVTPWGTYLMAEENFNNNFSGALAPDHAESANHQRYNVPSNRYAWSRYYDRYDVSKAPNEPNRYGWIVEVDPSDPASMPKKRTALGRFKHEGAESVVAPDGRVVVYMGDDQRFDYVYKFVTAKAFDPANPAAARELLDEGTLYVARFDADGYVDWLPLTYGEGPLTAENGFFSQADVVIEARRAGDLLGATPMDRPEDVEANPKTGRVYVMLTNNSQRTDENTNAANPRGPNYNGHVIEIIEPDGDYTATRSRWEFLIKCGDPSDGEVGAMWNPLTTSDGWFSSPDNCAVDPQGRLWIATDGNDWNGTDADGLFAIETEGERRGTSRAFLRAPAGAEVCGPRFSADGETLFVAIQHPGDTRGSSFENPGTRWPDFSEAMPPRPSVLAIRRKDGGPVGGAQG